MPEDLRQQRNDQQLITGHLNNENRNIRNEGCVDTSKASFNIRLLSIRTYGFTPSKDEKFRR